MGFWLPFRPSDKPGLLLKPAGPKHQVTNPFSVKPFRTKHYPKLKNGTVSQTQARPGGHFFPRNEFYITQTEREFEIELGEIPQNNLKCVTLDKKHRFMFSVFESKGGIFWGNRNVFFFSVFVFNNNTNHFFGSSEAATQVIANYRRGNI